MYGFSSIFASALTQQELQASVFMAHTFGDILINIILLISCGLQLTMRIGSTCILKSLLLSALHSKTNGISNKNKW